MYFHETEISLYNTVSPNCAKNSHPIADKPDWGASYGVLFVNLKSDLYSTLAVVL